MCASARKTIKAVGRRKELERTAKSVRRKQHRPRKNRRTIPLGVTQMNSGYDKMLASWSRMKPYPGCASLSSEYEGATVRVVVVRSPSTGPAMTGGITMVVCYGYSAVAGG